MEAVFYSRHRTAASRTNGQAAGLRLLFVLFLSAQEKDTFLLSKGERNVLFSLRRKAPKDSLRLSPQTPLHLLGSTCTRLEGVAVLAKLAQATTPRAGRNCEWEARARRRKARAV